MKAEKLKIFLHLLILVHGHEDLYLFYLDLLDLYLDLKGSQQLGKTDLENSHLRLLVYRGDEDDVVAMSDYYADYAKALEIMMEQDAEDIDDEEFTKEDSSQR